MRAQRRGEGPARVDAAEGQHADHHGAGRHIQVPAQQVDLRKRQVLRAHHDRDTEVSNRRRHRWHQKQKNHDDAVRREHLVVGVRGQQIARRGQQFQTNQPRHRSADKEEERDRDEIQHRDPLVVARQQPALQPVLFVEIRNPRQRGRRLVRQCKNCAHGFTVPGASAGADVPGGVAPVCIGCAALLSIVCSIRYCEFSCRMYSTRSIRPSSLT